MYLGITSQAKEEIEIYNYYYQTKKMKKPNKMINEKNCEICKKSGEIHFRVKSVNYTKWIFCCNKCWNIVSKEENSYGGTRKS